MNELLSQSVTFGMLLTLLAYWAGVKVREKTGFILCNPLLIGAVIVIVFLVVFHVDFETYNRGASYISYMMTPATVSLAVPLYRQLKVLKENAAAVFISLAAGCLAHLAVVVSLGALVRLEPEFVRSFLPKSVTSPIAISLSGEIGGLEPVTILGVMIAGLLGAILAPALFTLFHVDEPVAQGLGIGCASHALGTSKAVELGDVQAAMSSLAIVVTGVMTVLIVPLVVRFL